MWVEQQPREGDTVKVTFADFTNLGTKIGVCLYPCNKVQFGDCIRNLTSGTTFFVWSSPKY